MRKTTMITFVCKITGYTRYWLEFDIVGTYWFCRTISSKDYYANNLVDFLSHSYIKDPTSKPEASVNIATTPHIYDIDIRIPIERDPVVMQDFFNFEDKSVVTPPSQFTSSGPYTITLPTGSSFLPESLISNKISYDKDCRHEPYTYTGLSQINTYCKKCEKKLD